MLTVDELVQKVGKYHPQADMDLIRKAYAFSERSHRTQLRKSGDPYFIHPVHVASIIADLRLDAASICAGLLHDVIEDTETTAEGLAKDFGGEVSEIVDGVTKLGRINFRNREDRQAESFRKMVLAMARDIRVLLIKLCDRLDNMRTLDHMKPDAQERIARETLDIYAPLANRLGIQWVKSELEDLAFRYLYPDEYKDVTKRLGKSQKERNRYIDTVSKTLVSRLAEQGFSADISGRAKHLFSIYRKMRLHQCEFEQIYDLIAFRICVESVADCYATLGVVHSKWMPIPGRFKDYIALPKPNRYQSLHTTVVGPSGQRLEIQIRTHDMHRVAEHGVAAHWQYKERLSGGVHPDDALHFSWLRELADFQNNFKDPAEFLETVKIDLFPDEVYVFTPKGDVHVLPRGATPLDFAYAVHSEVGHHCSGARANGQILSLRNKLKNGDVIEVMTSANQHPSKDWLDFCVTSRARARIRAYLRGDDRKKSINLGRELLESEMRTAGMSFSKLQKTESKVGRLLSHHHFGSLDELLLALGHGRLEAEALVATLRSDQGTGVTQPPPELKTGAIENLVRKVTRREVGAIRVAGLEDLLVRYGKCCTPLPGDPIVGFITRGRGVTVHRRECIKAFDTDPTRRIEVLWDTRAKVNHPVQLTVITTNKPGILATVSQTFSSQRINISEANCRSEDPGRARNVFTFQVQDLSELKTIMRALSKIQGVVEVSRV